PSIMINYSNALTRYADALPNARVFALVTPNGGEFYSPEEFHTGPYSQKDMIDKTYADMSDKVITVDAYYELRQHVDKYIFFRTDHHWTQLGAYYAYTAFCKSAGLDPVPLDEFETGTQEDFVGSMYGFTSHYPQSAILKENPDTLHYYRPVREYTALSFPNAELNENEAIPVYVVASKNSSANKYLSFIGGDTPAVRIRTDVGNGKKIVVVKESYGNAFVPFLVNHYEEVYVIDPRKYMGADTPNLDLPAFVEAHGIEDVLVIDYPVVVSNQNYIDILNNIIPN
ncbi:hypothetical protein LJC34_04970, partial [Oscillospiraceae bacterium OttesenSCG-928-G22]|nr:hypothetical protein [Oscillospiraceae bacterium OttesenSCG-928-G22]